LIDTSCDSKYQENIGLQKWGLQENLKIVAKTYRLMNSKNINNFSELSNKINSIQNQSKASNESIITLEHKIKELDLIKQNMEQYFNTNIEKETTKDKNHSHSNQEL